MLTLTLANGNEYEVLEETAVYPSGSPSLRSRMEVHMPPDAMALEQFAAAFSDEAATAELRLAKTVDADDEARGRHKGDILFETAYRQYCIVAGVGKKRVQATDPATGLVGEAMHLVAELEQRTYIEQQLAALGL